MGVGKKRNRVSDHRLITTEKVISICISTVLLTVKTRVITIDLSFPIMAYIVAIAEPICP